MKYFKFPKYSKIALITSAILLAIGIIIRLLERQNIYLYLFGTSNKEIKSITILLVAILIISSISLILYKNTKHKTLVVVASVVLSFIILSYLSLVSLLSFNGTYFEYTSDDQKHDIVVKECALLLAGWGDIYEKTSFFTMKKVGSYTTDDGFCPFSKGTFRFVWNKDNFELHYPFFIGNNAEDYRVEKMDYAS